MTHSPPPKATEISQKLQTSNKQGTAGLLVTCLELLANLCSFRRRTMCHIERIENLLSADIAFGGGLCFGGGVCVI